MSEFDPRLVSTLDRLHPPTKTAGDWADVLRRAAELRGSARPSRPGARLSTRIVPAVAVGVAAIAAGLALTTPWSGGPSFIARALAAIGSDRYVVATVEPGGLSIDDVDLATGRERPVEPRVAYWLDSKRIEYHSWTYLDGVPVASETAGPDPALAAFARGYRAALADRTAVVVGSTTVAGRTARIIRFKLTSFYANGERIHFLGAQPTRWEDVAVDTSTYRPLWFQQGGLTESGAPVEGPRSRVVSVRAAAQPPAIPKQVPVYEGTATTLRRLTPDKAPRALGHAALWPGGRVRGLALRSLLLQRVTTSLYPVVYPPLRSARGLRLVYQRGSARLELSEAPTPLAGYGFASATRTAGLGAIPSDGTIRITPFGYALGGPVDVPRASSQPAIPWLGQLRRDGLYVTIRATSRPLLLAAARALAPMK